MERKLKEYVFSPKEGPAKKIKSSNHTLEDSGQTSQPKERKEKKEKEREKNEDNRTPKKDKERSKDSSKRKSTVVSTKEKNTEIKSGEAETPDIKVSPATQRGRADSGIRISVLALNLSRNC